MSTTAYTMRVSTDAFSPAIRRDWFVVADPESLCTPGELVVLQQRGRAATVQRLVRTCAASIVCEPAAGGAARTIARDEIEHMDLVAAVVPPSRWRAVTKVEGVRP